MKKSKKEEILKEALSEFVADTGAENLDLTNEFFQEQIETMDKDDVAAVKEAMIVVSHFYLGMY